MECRHDDIWYSDVRREVCGVMRWVQILQCARCHDWLPLGPARDDGPHAEQVAIEIRAAELAADPPKSVLGVHHSVMSECHLCGFGFAMGIEAEFGGEWEEPDDAGSEWHAGYLAHAIVTHDNTPEAARDRLAQRRANAIASHDKETP